MSNVLSLFARKPKRRTRIQPKEPRKWLKLRIEIKDVLVFGGLGMAGYGIWQIYPPSALIVVGGVFFAIGIYWYAGGKVQQ